MTKTFATTRFKRLAVIAMDRRLKKEDEYVARSIVRNAAASIPIENQESLNRFTDEILDKCKRFLRHNYERFRHCWDDYSQFLRHLSLATEEKLSAAAKRAVM